KNLTPLPAAISKPGHSVPESESHDLCGGPILVVPARKPRAQSTAKRVVWTARAVWRSEQTLGNDRVPNIRARQVLDCATLGVVSRTAYKSLSGRVKNMSLSIGRSSNVRR